MTKIDYYIVGGSIRDSILGIKTNDIDYAVEAPSFAAMREDIITRNGEIFLESPEHFTIRAKVPGIGAADFVLCRKDGVYSDGRHPDSVEIGTIHDDLARRDFTMNAIAKDEQGVYLDPHNGLEDIKFRLIRCVGVAEDRLREDALRMLRAIRFAVTKNFVIDPSIELCLHSNEMLEKLDNISLERIREELYKCFVFNTPKTLGMLLHTYPGLGSKVFSYNRLYLKPTLSN